MFYSELLQVFLEYHKRLLYFNVFFICSQTDGCVVCVHMCGMLINPLSLSGFEEGFIQERGGKDRIMTHSALMIPCSHLMSGANEGLSGG